VCQRTTLFTAVPRTNGVSDSDGDGGGGGGGGGRAAMPPTA